MKPFQEAKYLLCQERNVSGLDIAAALRDSIQVASPVLFCMALLLIGDEGKVMILEQDTVVLLDFKHYMVLHVADFRLACYDLRLDTGLPTREVGVPILVRLTVSVCVFVVVLAMCLQVTTTHGKSTTHRTDRDGGLGP